MSNELKKCSALKEAEKFWCHEASNIRCVRASDYDALRQQLADVSNERDGLLAALNEDRESLQYLLGQFDAEVCVCDRCGEEKELKDSDSAEYLREYLANVTIWGAQS